MQIIHNSYIFKRFQNERYETLIASLILKVKDNGTQPSRNKNLHGKLKFSVFHHQ